MPEYRRASERTPDQYCRSSLSSQWRPKEPKENLRARPVQLERVLQRRMRPSLQSDIGLQTLMQLVVSSLFSRQTTEGGHGLQSVRDRKSTRLNSSHLVISYA